MVGTSPQMTTIRGHISWTAAINSAGLINKETEAGKYCGYGGVFLDRGKAFLLLVVKSFDEMLNRIHEKGMAGM